MGFNLAKAFTTDKRAETEGRKLTLVPAKDGQPESYLLIARKGNPGYKQFLSKALQENNALLQTKTEEAEAVASAIFKDAASRFLLIGWQGIDWEDDKNVAYSAQTAREMFQQSEDFFRLVDNFAGEMSNYRAEEVAKDAKN